MPVNEHQLVSPAVSSNQFLEKMSWS